MKSIFLSVGPLKAKVRFLESVTGLQELGFTIYATQGTHIFLENNGIHSILLHKPSSRKTPQALDFIAKKKISIAVVIPDTMTSAESDGYKIRRHAVDFGVPLIVTLQQATTLVSCLEREKQ